MIVAGTRPELIKLAPVFWELKRRDVEYVFVWSGQHYDYEMSRVFIEELELPEPDFDLGVSSGSHAIQTAKAMIGVEEAIQRYKPSLTVALGDTNTVVATALASVKSLVPFAHIEAGLRSWNMSMPEEINRKVADHVAQLLFTPSTIATINVLAEGIESRRVFQTGNTIIDVLNKAMEIADKHESTIAEQVRNFIDEPFLLVTVHRQENTDNPQRLTAIVRALVRLSSRYRIVIPLHPRTRRKIIEYGLMNELANNRSIRLLKPLGYLEFLYVLKHAYVVLTDSGGVQEEAFTLRIPTVTLRYNTERPETILLGCNVLAGAATNRIVEYTLRMAEIREAIRSRLGNVPNPYGDGRASERIVDAIAEHLEEPQSLVIHEPDLRDTPLITYMVKELSNLDPRLDEVLCYIDRESRLTPEVAKAIAAYIRSRVRVAKPWESLGY
jgi:UDP-N-acetylglucosamine 2-epimerase (non-hydrolysing)